MKPLGAIEYLEYLSPLVGKTRPKGGAPIIAVMDCILLLAVRRGVDELRIEVRPDDDFALDIRGRKGNEWTAWPGLNCRGSAISRLLVAGNLEKGEAARSKPQRGQATIHGVKMMFESEPVRAWRENMSMRLTLGSRTLVRIEPQSVC